jgi:hypothetical protein
MLSRYITFFVLHELFIWSPPRPRIAGGSGASPFTYENPPHRGREPIPGQSDNGRTRQREHNYAAYRRVISTNAARPSPVNEYGALNY